ncbi:transglycosylase [Xaviernesmea oryzae]|uniref:peptidoglycan lytic exotransglycosylase n=1 Tax=Xaviernesmea oryzae TaxID=464029 RepID=A0A1Q9AY73_9HYPH|nr:murein transglycosylase A [Xaviernesmea oryzae]OLP60412.1 transglycosylase [Xaviernesmea oryzae]SEK19531.1 membrane-bound lytic murein transglycosylase A [Xaviernesmea oryzae]
MAGAAETSGFALEPLSFTDLPGWQADDPRPVFAAIRRCRRHIETVKPHRTGSFGLSSADLLPAFRALEAEEAGTAEAARALIEANFQPFRITPDGAGEGFVTAFYEPVVAVSHRKDEVWRYPFYRRPDDLVDLSDENRPEGFDPSFAFAKATAQGLVVHEDRGAIERGALDGRGLEIAYARSKVDVFFAHVQGAARLLFPDSSMRRITYAAKTGHPFSPIGKRLIERGAIKPADISMQTIRAWLEQHPDQADALMWENRSFIFFREAEVDDPDLGPIAAAKVPLEPGRSLAVDRLIHTFGTPFYIASESLTRLDQGRPFQRLMLALDTGSAIIGPARGDIFTGSGDAAGDLAGAVRHPASFFVLIPSAVAARYGGGHG